MGKKYFEIVFEGDYKTICGMLEGFLLAKGEKWEWYPSKESGIEPETFTDIIKEWASLKTKLHHLVLEEDFHNSLHQDLKARGDLRYIKLKYTKSAKEIKSCSFKFNAHAFAKKYGEEIKNIIASAPAGVSIENYNPVEEIDKESTGVELYAPVHDYTFKAEGIVSGGFGDIIVLRKILDDHPLVQVSSIRLKF